MKSDGIDQMNTVAKTAEYPFERFALWGEAGSLLAVDILYFIASGPGLLNGRSVRGPQLIGYACCAQSAGPVRQRTLQHLRCTHLNFGKARCINFLACKR